MWDYEGDVRTGNDAVVDEIAKLTRSRGLDATQPLPTVVVDSWKRCLADHQLLPDRVPRAAVLTHEEMRDLTERYGDLLSIAAPEVEKLFLRLVDSEYLVSLASPQGVMMLFRCDHQFLGDMSNFGVLPGSVWTEERQGTNGVGTCLRIGKPVTIIGSHHYGIDTQSLTCLTAPVLGRLGLVESVLNVTTPRAGDERTNRVVENIVARAARRIENRYFSRLHQNATILRLSGDREYVDLAEEARVAINADGVIFAGTSYVATLMGCSAVEDIVGQSAEELFELGVALSEIRPEKPFQVHLGEKPLYASVTDQTFRTVKRGVPAAPSLTVPAQPITIYEPGKTGDLPGDELRLDPMTAMALDRARRLLEAGLPIIVKGETGTGKTTFARLAASRTFGNQHATFVVDCCATSGIAIASAAAQVVGANRSDVLILDRLDELDPAGQTALLTILEGNIRPLAARCMLIVVATADLDDLAREGVLRPDLLHRVKGGSIELPPLRNRPDLDETIEDLLRLELASLGKFGLKLDEEARLVLANYHWPGNLRELRYALRHAAVLADGGNIQLHHLPSNIVFEIARKDLTARSQAEASRIEAVLRFNGGNVSRTAKHLGVSRATLYRKIQIQKSRQES